MINQQRLSSSERQEFQYLLCSLAELSQRSAARSLLETGMDSRTNKRHFRITDVA